MNEVDLISVPRVNGCGREIEVDSIREAEGRLLNPTILAAGALGIGA